MRVFLAFVVSPLFASAVFVALGQVPLSKILQWWLLVSAVAGVLTAMFAVPIYIWLRNRRRLTFPIVIVASVAIPVIFDMLISVYGMISSGVKYSFFAKGHLIIDEGSYTAYGLWHRLVSLSQIALCGSIAGICFWLIAHRKWGTKRDSSGNSGAV